MVCYCCKLRSSCCRVVIWGSYSRSAYYTFCFSILEYVSWNHLENSQDAVQSFVDTLYKMDMLLDKKKTSKNPQTKTQKIQQPSIHINVGFYIISVLSQGDKKQNLVFINYYFQDTGRKLFAISVRTKWTKIFWYIKLQRRRE